MDKKTQKHLLKYRDVSESAKDYFRSLCSNFSKHSSPEDFAEKARFLTENFIHQWFASAKCLDDDDFESALEKDIFANEKIRLICNVIGNLRYERFHLDIEDEYEVEIPYTQEELEKQSKEFWNYLDQNFDSVKGAFYELQEYLDKINEVLKDSLVKKLAPISLPHTSLKDMSKKEAAFYKLAESYWSQNKFIDLEGNSNYAWNYIHNLLKKRLSQPFEETQNKLVMLAEQYCHDEVLSSSCEGFANDLALEFGFDDLFYDRSEIQKIFGSSYTVSYERLNVACLKGKKVHPSDLICYSGSYLGSNYSKLAKTNYALFKNCLYEEFENYEYAHGLWTKMISEWNGSPYECGHYLYPGSKHLILHKQLYKDFRSEMLDKIVGKLYKNAEKRAIDILKNGNDDEYVWLEKLFNDIHQQFPQLQIFLESRPTFSNGKILPIYFPYKNVVLCSEDIKNACDGVAVEKRGIKFVDIGLDLNKIVDELQHVLEN